MMINSRFTLKISGKKEFTKEDFFPDEPFNFIPSSEDMDELLDGISITKLVENFNLLRDLELVLIDNATGDEWVYIGFGWNKI